MGSYFLENITLGAPLLRVAASDDQDIFTVSEQAALLPTPSQDNVSVAYSWSGGGSDGSQDLLVSSSSPYLCTVLTFEASTSLASNGQTEMIIDLSNLSGGLRPPTDQKFAGVFMIRGALDEVGVFEHKVASDWRIVKHDGSAWTDTTYIMGGFQLVY